MTKTVVGLFENARDVDATRSDLKALDLDQHTTTFVDRHEPDLRDRLVEAGIPQPDAQLLADGVGQGQQLIVAQGIADDDAVEVTAIMDRHNVIDGNRTASTTTTRPATGGMSAGTAPAPPTLDASTPSSATDGPWNADATLKVDTSDTTNDGTRERGA